jgi:uncharacterized membrane protein YccC
MSHARPWAFDGSGPARLATGLRAATPALLFGLRLWAAVSLALYLAFWLQLDNPSWAGTSAAVVCQPGVGAALRKGWFRVIGTIAGAVMIVVLTACFPQQRIGFLLGLALWCAASGLLATLLRNFASYAAALAGYTAAIIAADELGATGGTSPDVFLLAVSRASEIGIGIVCAGAVLAATDFGGARRRLAAQLAALSAEIAGRLAATFALTGPALADTRPVRRDLVRQVIALDPVIEEAIGESSDLRLRAAGLRTALQGLFAALAGWRTVAVHLETVSDAAVRGEAGLVLDMIPSTLRAMPTRNQTADWAADPSDARNACAAAVRALAALPSRTPSLRLLADQTARALIGIRRALDGVALLADPGQRIPVTRPARFQVPDWLPALVSAGRIFVTIAALELLWVVTEWPNGAGAITFAAIVILLFSPRADEAYAIAMKFMAGTLVATAMAGLVKFAVLPGVTSFAGFSLAIGLVLVPAGAMIARPWQPGLFLAVTAGLIPLMAPTNQMSYDTAQFYNAALSILAGVGAATLAFRLLPPPSPALRTRRLLAFTLRDLRRLATAPVPRTAQDWEDRAYGRLSALPEQAEPLQRAELLAALAVGREVIHLRRVARRLMADSELDAALDALARGDSRVASERLAHLDAQLAAVPNATPGAQIRLRGRGSILAVMEALTQHAAYFDAEAAR